MEGNAPGWPEIPARLTLSAGVAWEPLCEGNRHWFSRSRGIVNEIYSPRLDRACTSDLGTKESHWPRREEPRLRRRRYPYHHNPKVTGTKVRSLPRVVNIR